MRFVFRDLDVGQPLTEFDFERLGQSLKAALGVLVAGGPGALSRADAAIASGVTLAGTPPPLAVAPPPAQPPSAALRFRLAGFYQATSVGSGLFHGPGVIATLSDRGRLRDPEIWLTAGYDIPGEFGNQIASLLIDALWMRAGLSLRLTDTIRLGAGGGFDRQTTRLVYLAGAGNGYVDRSVNYIAAGRLFARIGPTSLAGIDVSLTAFLDVAGSTERDAYVGSSTTANAIVSFTLYRSNVLRPGFALELWWR
jgi:hypothetical protein